MANKIVKIIITAYNIVTFRFEAVLQFVRNVGQQNFTESTCENIQLISVGDAKTGKSCIIKRYCQGRFVSRYITTIGVDYGVKKVDVNKRKVQVNFFDLSGSPDYEQIRNNFFADSQVVFLVFDLEKKQTFQNLARWENIMKSNGLNLKECTVFVLGNKSDSKAKQVDSSQAIAFAKKRGYEYYQTSASSGQNINQTFDRAFHKAVQLHQEKRKTLT